MAKLHSLNRVSIVLQEKFPVALKNVPACWYPPGAGLLVERSIPGHPNSKVLTQHPQQAATVQNYYKSLFPPGLPNSVYSVSSVVKKSSLPNCLKLPRINQPTGGTNLTTERQAVAALPIGGVSSRRYFDLFKGRILGGPAIDGSGAGVALVGFCLALLSGLAFRNHVILAHFGDWACAIGEFGLFQSIASCWFNRDYGK